jgi:hypothetical protein
MLDGSPMIVVGNVMCQAESGIAVVRVPMITTSVSGRTDESGSGARCSKGGASARHLALLVELASQRGT